ncbi:hypothetical protein F4810DRAFT_696152 [Camillea tinctor]|nr:hypothetical protein F4810DRAFT_696152 [Camillea tinctor]
MPPKRRHSHNAKADSDGAGGHGRDDLDIPHNKRRKCTAVLHVQPIQRRGLNEPHQVIHLTAELDFNPIMAQKDQDPHDIVFHIFHGKASMTTTTLRADRSMVPEDSQEETNRPPHDPHWVWHLTDGEKKKKRKQQNEEVAARVGDLRIVGSFEEGAGGSIDFAGSQRKGKARDDDGDGPWTAEPGPHIDIPETGYGGAGIGSEHRERGENGGEVASRERWGRRRQEELIIGFLLGMIVMWANVLIIVLIFLYDKCWQNMVNDLLH